MLWIKRNLDVAIAGGVALLLVVLGTLYLLSKKGEYDTLKKDLDETVAKLRDARTRGEVAPTPENVAAVKRDAATAQEYVQKGRQLASPTPYAPLTPQTYRSFLSTNTADLRQSALNAGVQIPTNYNFSFEAQSRPVSFQASTLKPLAEQLEEIAVISRALFRAHITRLELIRRVPTSEYDVPGSPDILPGANFETNVFAGTVSVPYEFVFETFSQQLGNALNELAAAPRMLVVKVINIRPSDAAEPVPGIAPAGNPPPGVPPGVAPGGFPGRGGRRFPGFPGAAPGVGARPGVAVTVTNELRSVLDEHLLRVEMRVSVLKPAS